MAEITPSTLDENPGASTAIHTGSEKRVQMLDNVVSGRRRVFNFELTFWCVCEPRLWKFIDRDIIGVSVK